MADVWAVVSLVWVAVLILVAVLAYRYIFLAQHASTTVRGIGLDTRPKASVFLRDGFGNQLFQVAALLGYCERHQLQPVLDLSKVSVNAYLHQSNLCTDWYHEFAYASVPTEFQRIVEGAALAPPDDRMPVLEGWFQSVAFLPSPEILKTHLHPPAALVERVRSLWASYLENPKSTVLHVRRGDYTSEFNRKKYLVDTKETYYRAALTEMATRVGVSPDVTAHLMVFSDDIEWCKKFLDANPPRGYMPVYVRGGSAQEDLALMCQFKHHILSNSTFGWWGAVLAESLDVCAPYPWDSTSDRKDIYMPHWTLL